MTAERQNLNIHIQIKKAKYTWAAFPRKLYVWETLRLSANNETIANKLQHDCNLGIAIVLQFIAISVPQEFREEGK